MVYAPAMLVQLPLTAAHREVQLQMAKPTLRTWLLCKLSWLLSSGTNTCRRAFMDCAYSNLRARACAVQGPFTCALLVPNCAV